MVVQQQNVDVLERAFHHVNRHELDECVALLTADFVINIAEMPYQKTGTTAWREHTQALLGAFPDVRVTVEDAVAADDKVAVRVRIRGTHTGADFIGLPPTGNTVDYESHEIYRFTDGKIAEEWICSDTMTMLTQIGLMKRGRVLSAWLSGYKLWVGVLAGAAVTAAVAVLLGTT